MLVNLGVGFGAEAFWGTGLMRFHRAFYSRQASRVECICNYIGLIRCAIGLCPQNLCDPIQAGRVEVTTARVDNLLNDALS